MTLLEQAADIRASLAELETVCGELRSTDRAWVCYKLAGEDAAKLAEESLGAAYRMIVRTIVAAEAARDRPKAES